MNVAQLIEVLLTLPQRARVDYVYDGGVRGSVRAVYVSRDHRVIIADIDEPIYYDEDRPSCAPSVDDDPHWCVSDLQSPPII